jgi:hypothetical protein
MHTNQAKGFSLLSSHERGNQMATMKTLYTEYYDLVESVEFGNRTPENLEAYLKWVEEHTDLFKSMGIDMAEMSDQIYEELDEIYSGKSNSPLEAMIKRIVELPNITQGAAQHIINTSVKNNANYQVIGWDKVTYQM